MFEKAIDLDSNFAKAHAGLSLVHQDDVSGGWTADRERSLESALTSAQKAVELDPTEPLGYMALGLLYQYYADNERAIPQLEKAHDLNPNNFRYMWALGYALAYTGDAARAVELLDMARRVNPYHPEGLLRALGQANFFAGRYEQAIAELSKITRRHRTSFWLYLAASHAMLGNTAEAQAAISEALKLDPDIGVESEVSRRAANGLSRANAQLLREALLRAGLPT
jgi:adenylate cyclase